MDTKSKLACDAETAMPGVNRRLLDAAHSETLPEISPDGQSLDRTATPAAIPITGSPKRGSLPVIPSDYYDIQDEIARGGLGRVTQAEDTRLRRKVALKELLDKPGVDNRRFLREARITARLQHPSIVPVYEAGYWPNGAPFYAMKLVSGDTLADLVKAASTTHERLVLVPYVIAVVDAIAYAHSHRIIHRDLKPSNIIIGEYGETMVVDWGLAKDLARNEDDSIVEVSRDAADGITVVGSIMGTPGYMAPEQANGIDVDERADIYSLGAILYYALSAKPPIKGTSLDDFLQRINEEEPEPVGRRCPDAPEELAAIIGKAMARDREQRYQTAKELSEDLKRFQNGQLVSAHKYTIWSLTRRWVGKHRTLVALASVLVTALLATAALSVLNVMQARDAAETRYLEAEQAKRDVRLRNRDLVVLQAAMAPDSTTGVALLDTLTDTEDDADWSVPRGIASAANNRGVSRHVWRDHRGSITNLELSADGSILASSSHDGTIRLRSTADGSMRVLRAHTKGIEYIAFSPVRRQLLSTGGDGKVRTWRLDGTPLRVFDDHTGLPMVARYSPDGRYLAHGDSDGVVYVRDLDEDVVRRFEGHRGQVHAVAFSPDGVRLASTAGHGELRTWHLGDDTQHRVLEGHEAVAWDLRVSADGRYLATSGKGTDVAIWRFQTGELVVRLEHQSRVWNTAFSPVAPERIVSVTANGSVYSWDIATRTGTRVGGHTGVASIVAFSPDGSLYATGGEDGAVRVWNAHTSQLERWYRTNDGLIGRVRFSADGKRLWSGAKSNTLREWDLTKPTALEIAGGERGPVDAMALAPNGRAIAVGHRNGAVRVWNLDRGGVHELRGHDAPIDDLVFVPDSASLLSASEDGSIWLHRLLQGTAERVGGHTARVRRLRLSPNGRYLASASDDRTVTVWDIVTLERRWTGHHMDRVRDIAFSHDGDLLASASDDQTVRRWNVTSGQLLDSYKHDARVRQVRFSPNDENLATGSDDGAVRLWSLSSKRPRALKAHRGGVFAVEFSPDGRRIASLGYDDRYIAVWNLNADTHERLPSQVPLSLAWHPDGIRLASSHQNGALRLWDMQTGRGHDLGRVDGQLDRLQYAPDGTVLVTGSRNALVTVWRDDLPTEKNALRAWLSDATTAAFDPDTLMATSPLPPVASE